MYYILYCVLCKFETCCALCCAIYNDVMYSALGRCDVLPLYLIGIVHWLYEHSDTLITTSSAICPSGAVCVIHQRLSCPAETQSRSPGHADSCLTIWPGSVLNPYAWEVSACPAVILRPSRDAPQHQCLFGMRTQRETSILVAFYVLFSSLRVYYLSLVHVLTCVLDSCLGYLFFGVVIFGFKCQSIPPLRGVIMTGRGSPQTLPHSPAIIPALTPIPTITTGGSSGEDKPSVLTICHVPVEHLLLEGPGYKKRRQTLPV